MGAEPRRGQAHLGGDALHPPHGPAVLLCGVRDASPRTTCEWGLSPAEVRRIWGAMHFIRRTGLPCCYAVLGDSVLDMAEREARALFRAATSYIVQAQGRARLPQFWLRVFESTGGLHANLIFPASPTVAARFRRSRFGAYCGGKGLQEIGPTDEDWRTLVSYLATER